MTVSLVPRRAGAPQGDDEVRLLREQLRLVHRRAPSSVGGALICASALTLWLDGAVSDPRQWIWWTLLCLVSIWRLSRVLGFARRDDSGLDPERESRRTASATFVAGCLWGAWPLLFHADHEVDTLLLVSSVYAAMLAVSAASNAVHWPTFLSFSVPQTLPLVGLHLASEVPELETTGWLLAMFFVVNLALGRRAHAQAAQLVRQRFTNQDLASDLAREKARVERTLFARSRFLAAASHDLRQPLHAMRMLIAGLRTADAAARPSIHADLGSARDALQYLFDAVLDVAHVEADVLVVDSAPVALAASFETLRRTFEPAARAKDLGFHADAGGLSVRSDRVLLQRVLLNLVGNAIRYTPTGGIEIVAYPSGDEGVVIAIDDTGIGIGEEEHFRVFDAYSRVGDSDASPGPGVGLGLAIVRRLCELLRVGLAIQSAPGQGTRVELRLERCTSGTDPPSVGEGGWTDRA